MKDDVHDKVADLFIKAITAFAEEMRGRPWTTYVRGVARSIVDKMPPECSPQYFLPAMRHLFVNAIDIWKQQR